MSRKVDPSEIKWFGPIWRRIALVLVMAGWCAAEWFGGDQFWFLMTLAVLAYLVWRLFIAFPSASEIAQFEANEKKAAEERIARQKAEQEAAEREDVAAAETARDKGETP